MFSQCAWQISQRRESRSGGFKTSYDIVKTFILLFFPPHLLLECFVNCCFLMNPKCFLVLSPKFKVCTWKWNDENFGLLGNYFQNKRCLSTKLLDVKATSDKECAVTDLKFCPCLVSSVYTSVRKIGELWINIREVLKCWLFSNANTNWIHQ